MDWDHLAEEQSQRLFASWLRILFKASPALPLRLAQKHRPEAEAREASSPVTGSFNICTMVTFEDGFKAIVRFPILGRSRFRVEKTNDELLVMQYLTPRTNIPIPKILGAGAWDCGTYIVSTFVEGTLLSKCLPHPAGQSSGLSPDVSSSELSRAYRAMADIMLELHRLPFPRIGAIANVSRQWKVGKRPLTLNMNELVRVGNYPPSDFSQSSFQTASEYFQELARQQYLHLQYQRNDAITDKHDCRKMYVARCLFRKIAKHIPTKKDLSASTATTFAPQMSLFLPTLPSRLLLIGSLHTSPQWNSLTRPLGACCLRAQRLGIRISLNFSIGTGLALNSSSLK